MKIPLRYNLASLWVRRTGTLMTVLGIALTVAIFVIMLALVHGMESTYVETGRQDQILLLRQGSLTEINSFFEREALRAIEFLPSVARGAEGEPLASGEIVVVINHPRISGGESNITVRGLTETGLKLRPELTLEEGRWFRPGLRELVVSRSLSQRFQDLQLGRTVSIAKSRWSVVGLFTAAGTAYESEILGDYTEIAADWDRSGSYSSILVRAASKTGREEIVRRASTDQRFNLQAIAQTQYFQDQVSTVSGIRALGYFIALVMGIGACFAAMNMMYGTVMSRAKEIGTLRALGFRSRSILASFLVESLMLSLAGGILGCLLSLPMHGISTGTANFQTFSEILFRFRITPAILATGLLFAALVGLLGGTLPSRRAARVRLLDVIRD